jgi:integrase
MAKMKILPTPDPFVSPWLTSLGTLPGVEIRTGLPGQPSPRSGPEHQIEQLLEVCDLRASTRSTYRRALKHFFAWVEALNPRDPTILVRYKNHLTDRMDITAGTKNLYLAAVRTVYRKLFELGVLDRDLSHSVKTFVIPAGHRRSPITDAQVRRVFAYLDNKGDLRLQVLFNLLYRQGLRRKEVVGITVQDVDFENRTLMILGKGRDDKEMTQLHPKTLDALRTYLDAEHLKDGFVFRSKRSPEGHITTTQLYRLVRAIHEDLGIKNGPHAWRKVFTSRLIESGMGLLDVQRYTRHKSLPMLQVYYDRIDQRKTLPQYYSVFNDAVDAE